MSNQDQITPKTTEIIYTWPDGREEVRYRRPYNSDLAIEMIKEVQKLQYNNEPYSFRNV